MKSKKISRVNLRVNPRQCCSCTACFHSCNHHAICLIPNKYGFPVPKINENICTNCGRCEKVCPVAHPNIDEYCKFETPIVYGALHKSDSVRFNSQSGGAFTAISDVILQKDGIIYGCKLNDKYEVVHDRATTSIERDQFRGSKYVQSNMTTVLPRVKQDLMEGKSVLFSGTPCQIAGLRNYLHSINTDNLICVDIICHGVPSPKIWKEYLEFMKQHTGENKIADIIFADNTIPWRPRSGKIVIGTNTYSMDFYYRILFFSHFLLSPVCYNCPFRNHKRLGDLTIADLWSVMETMPELYDNKGISQILINTKQGETIFTDAKKSMNVKQTTLELAVNGGMEKNCIAHSPMHHIMRFLYRAGGVKLLYILSQTKILGLLNFGISSFVSLLRKIAELSK